MLASCTCGLWVYQSLRQRTDNSCPKYNHYVHDKMGSFRGHAVPGGMFIVFGIWWITQITKRRMYCELPSSPVNFRSSVTFTCGYGRWIHWPVEAGVKLLACLVGILGELSSITEWDR